MKKYIPVSGNNDVTHLRVELAYDIGGYNMMTYRPKPRGYYLTVVPVKREERYGCMMESFAAFSGYRQLMKEVTRKSAKAEWCSFAILLMNVASPLIERITYNKSFGEVKKA